MDMSIDRPSHWLQWAKETFGEIALAPDERALRFIEEAIELAHAMGIDSDSLNAVVRRVYSRPSGSVRREIGQCVATLELLALVVGINADEEATSELARVKSIPKSEWVKRHSAKVAIGIAR